MVILRIGVLSLKASVCRPLEAVISKIPKLSPTSYALLGLLARQPQSAYELNALMQKSVIRVFWPRAESHVYSEPRKLVAAGFASEREERAKGRQRTVYAITAEGRKALTEWLQAPATSELRTQSEFMLRFILSDSGPGQLPSALLDTALEASNSELAEAGAGILAILKNPGLALEGMPWNGLAINLMVDIMLARHAWLVDLRGSVPAQPMSQEDQRAAGMAAYEEALQKLRPLVPGIETGGILGTVYLIDDCD